MIEEKIVSWISEYAKNTNMNLVVGISGGIDSALVSTLCAKTGISTRLVSMPIHQTSDELFRARKHMDYLCFTYKNVSSTEIDLSGVFDNLKSLFPEGLDSKLALANSRSRLRMTTLYQIATSTNSLVVGTGNKVEDFGVGFFTKYGDGGVDLSPIADLTKTEVREMARRLNVCEEIIFAKPTDGLWDDGRTDEDQIGASYEELEWAMDFLQNPNSSKDISQREREVIQIFEFFHKKNLHKMVPIPVFKK